MAAESLQASTRRGIPDFDGSIVGRRYNLLRIVREGYGVDPVAMTLGCLRVLAYSSVPELNSMISRGRRDLLRVVRKGY